ncbi:MAG: T9SS type A sorting domain-containing protein, partial [Muribaculaceae bacterium]|nr:T9SS type A sorting domain-containing protein [Muribaculaceae bacterium]
YRLVDAVYFISLSTESVVFKQIGSKKKVYRRFTNDTNSSSYYFMQGTFGDKYLSSYLMLLRDGSLYNITKTYKTMYEESKDWNLISQTSVSEYYYPVTIQQSLIQPGIKSADTFTISQTLFNNDELFEYILPIPEKYDDEVLSEKNIGDITIPVKQTFAKWRINGYKIVNELGHEICRLTLPTGYDGATSMQLFDYGDEQYMTVNASIDTDSGKQTDTFVYKITREEHNAAIEQVGAPMRVDISPRLVSQSMPIDIKFSDESTQQRQIIVTSTNGVTQMVLTLSPQTLSATVDTSHLPAGMYVISVKDGESVTENCKVIIR